MHVARAANLLTKTHRFHSNQTAILERLSRLLLEPIESTPPGPTRVSLATVEASLNPPPAVAAALSVQQHFNRLQLVSKEWFSQPAAERDPAIFSKGIVPAYGRLGDHTDWSDPAQAQQMLSFPWQFQAAGVELHFPQRHIRSLLPRDSTDATLLSKRLEMATSSWRTTAKMGRAPAFFTEGILPAYRRLIEVADWSDNTVSGSRQRRKNICQSQQARETSECSSWGCSRPTKNCVTRPRGRRRTKPARLGC